MLVNLGDLKELMSMIRFFRWRSAIRLSLQDILSLLDLNAEFDWKRRLWFEIGKAQAESTLRDCKNDCLLPFFRSCVQEGFAKDILKVLDQGNNRSRHNVKNSRRGNRGNSWWGCAAGFPNPNPF